MHKSDLSIIAINVNCCLGFFEMGYIMGYMNPAFTTIDALFGLEDFSEFYNGFLAGIMPLGAALGSLLSNMLINSCGRKQGLIVIDVLIILSCMIQVSGSFMALIIGRFIIGITCGLNSVLVPCYMNEYTPDSLKGFNGQLVGILGNTGLILAFIFGFKFPEPVESNYWRFVFAFPALIAFVRTFHLLVFFKSDPPLYLCTIKEYDQCEVVLKELYHAQFVSEVLRNLKSEAISAGSDGSFSDLMKPEVKPYLAKGIILSIIQQCTGVNAVVFFSTSIFMQITDGNKLMSNLLNLGVPITGVVTGLLIGLFINRVTRKTVFVVGAGFCFIFMAVLGYLSQAAANPMLIMVFLFAFLIFYNFTLGPIYWVVLPELLPAKGVLFCAMTCWGFTGIIGQVFPLLVAGFSISFCFYLFSLFSLIGTIYLQLEFSLPSQAKQNSPQLLTELQTIQE